MTCSVSVIEIDGVKYVPESEAKPPVDLSDMVIARTVNAGVHYGKVKSKCLKEGRLTLEQSRRLWRWSGAASLSELALRGVKNPGDCRFAVRLPEIEVLGVIEVIPCSEDAVRVIEEVPQWTA